MKTRKLVLAILAPLVALGGTLAVADEMEMEAKEMRVWSAVLSEPTEEAAGVALKIIASQAAGGSNRMAIESVEVVSTSIGKDDEGNMTETMNSVACAGPFEVAGGGFTIEAAAPAEEGSEQAEAGEAEDPGCAFAVSGKVSHTYRAWHSWDMSGSVTAGEASMDFSIASAAPAMILEAKPEDLYGGRIWTEQEYREAALGKTLTVSTGFVGVVGDGTFSGTAEGKNATGTWWWEGEYYCRVGKVGNDPFEEDCHVLFLEGDRLTGIRNQRKGGSLHGPAAVALTGFHRGRPGAPHGRAEMNRT